MIEVKKFYAEWCGPCKMLTPLMEKIKPSYSDVSFRDINIDEEFEAKFKNTL